MLVGSLAAAATPCEGLKSMALADATITVAELVPAGPYTPPVPAARRRRRRPLAAVRLPAAGGGRGGRAAGASGAGDRAARALPRRGDPQALAGLGDRDGGVAAGRELERQVPGGRQRRMGRRDQLRGDGLRPAGRLRDRVHRYRAQGRQCALRDRPSGEGRRLRLPRRARDDGEGEGARSPPSTIARRASRTGTAARPADGRA